MVQVLLYVLWIILTLSLSLKGNRTAFVNIINLSISSAF